ncbi:MAG: hypothetical protein SFW09_07145 [Hyphomicrobiaceae bacterium]|nr:hypothetical protein [Hyphomicrobiaceae bacterium]
MPVPVFAHRLRRALRLRLLVEREQRRPGADALRLLRLKAVLLEATRQLEVALSQPRQVPAVARARRHRT